MDPSTKRILIILGLIAVLVIALFVVAVARNPDGNGEQSGCSASDRERLQKRLFGAKPVGPGQLSGCTRSLGSFVVPGSCVLVIAAADERFRRLVIETTDAIQLTIPTDADGRTLTMKPKLKRDKPNEISIGEDGQRIFFSCLGGTTCRAVLK